jgi:hypothetical protein
MARQKSINGATLTDSAGDAASNGERSALSVKTDDKGRVFSHIRQKWLVRTPEERVRQPNANELYPNDHLPTGVKPEDTCLELYRRFRKNPKSFLLEGGQS